MALDGVNSYKVDIKKEQDDLVVAYLPAVRALAYKLKERLPMNIEFNDLTSIGIEELVKLSRKYDKTLNDSFWGYSKKRVYGAMLDFLRSLDTISRSNRRIVKAVEAESLKYFNLHEEEPSIEHLSEVIGEDESKIKDAKIAAEINQVMPLDEQLSIFEDTKSYVLDKVAHDELVGMIEGTLNTLKEREQLIVQLYYFEELSLKEISEVLDITQSRISQIHKSIIAKIRQKLGTLDG
jgi:RNA polymerase sigma factor for flagellar operon FliA